MAQMSATAHLLSGCRPQFPRRGFGRGPPDSRHRRQPGLPEDVDRRPVRHRPRRGGRQDGHELGEIVSRDTSLRENMVVELTILSEASRFMIA